MADGVLLLVYWGLEEAQFPLPPHGLLQSFSCSSLLGLSISSTPKALAWGHGQQSTRDEVPAALVTLNSLPAWCRPQQQGQGLSSHPLSWTSAPIRWLLHRNQVVLVALGGDLSAKTCSEEPRAGGSGMSFQAGMPHIPLKKSEETWGMKRQYFCWARHYVFYSYYPSLSQYLKSWKLIEF